MAADFKLQLHLIKLQKQSVMALIFACMTKDRKKYGGKNGERKDLSQVH